MDYYRLWLKHENQVEGILSKEKTSMEMLRKMTSDRMRERGLSGEWWENNLYRVLIVKGKDWNESPVIQLSIRRHDNKPIDPPWRDKQAIKNQLVDPECEGVEIYPAESRLIDERNQYHLWVIADHSFRFTDAFGWKGARVTKTTNTDIDKGELKEE